MEYQPAKFWMNNLKKNNIWTYFLYEKWQTRQNFNKLKEFHNLSIVFGIQYFKFCSIVIRIWIIKKWYSKIGFLVDSDNANHNLTTEQVMHNFKYCLIL